MTTTYSSILAESVAHYSSAELADYVARRPDMACAIGEALALQYALEDEWERDAQRKPGLPSGRDRWSGMAKDVSDPDDRARAINPPVVATDAGVKGLASAILSGREGLLGAFRDALQAGVLKDRNSMLTVFSWLGKPVPGMPRDISMSREDARNVAYLVARVDGSEPLVTAVRAALNWGLWADSDAADRLAHVLGGATPTAPGLSEP